MTFPVQDVVTEIRKRVVGQDLMVERLLIGLLTGGHVLLEGVPGLAKTLTVHTLADVLHASFSRIQFTPDLLPADVVGTMIFESQHQKFTVRHGPIFAQIVLADEVNRAPAKVQSALLEAMQERQVSIGGVTFPLDEPFMVLATQNPIEQEGTYQLPEAQLDRFILKAVVGYPTRQEERQILARNITGAPAEVRRVVTPQMVLDARAAVREVRIEERLMDYILNLVAATRDPRRYRLDALAGLIAFGGSPRATISLAQAAQGYAFVQGRGYVTPEDVKEIAADVLRHRIVLTYEAEAEEVSSDQIVERVLESVEVP
ncbi:MAG: AAA family ATPase [Gemmatimonadales bacterium]